MSLPVALSVETKFGTKSHLFLKSTFKVLEKNSRKHVRKAC